MNVTIEDERRKFENGELAGEFTFPVWSVNQ